MLDKRFNFLEIEKKILAKWEREKLFLFKDSDNSKPYTIIMPPPNVTGSLHMGHALTFTLQDILIRFNKKLGMNVLWQPGTDHAGIATEIIVERKLIKEIKKTKSDLGRENFLKQIWKWKEHSGNKIVDQLKKLGTAIDWSISKFTLDDECSDAVKEAFIELYNEGYIYQDERLVNWDPKLQTAISDLEVNQKEVNGSLWFINYKIEGTNSFIEVATTRPETMFGDVAIAVHPKNKVFKSLIGKKAIIPLTTRSVDIIADEYADPSKGSGAVKITPAHDFNDFLIGKKHKLNFINIFDKKAKLNSLVPEELIGMDRYEARKFVIKFLKENGQLTKTKNNKMFVPIGERTGVVIEPLLTKQWFLDSKKLCNEVLSSIKKNEIKFHPQSWMNTFKHWINNIEPWCISRQIWWGHRIPIWYTDDGHKIAAKDLNHAKIFLKKKQIKGKITHQESDVLDTWFSSALWPFTTLNWPQKNKILSKHYPSDVLVTGFDIIFFWVARMIMMGLFFMKKVPFRNIYIHPLVKDEKGEKMSKSRGNVIDPIKMAEIYGSDSLRFTLANLSTQGRDIKLSNKIVENSRNFITKIWNVARFYEFNSFVLDEKYDVKKNKLSLNNWIIVRLNETKKKILKNLNEYKFNLLLNELYHFVWNDFCDLYLEFCKIYLKDEKNKKEISSNFSRVFKEILNFLNPIIPFVTEEISLKLKFSNRSLFAETFENNLFTKNQISNKDITDINKLIKLVKDIRAEFTGKNLNNSSLLIFSKNKVPWIDNNDTLLYSLFNFDNITYNNLNHKSKFIISSKIKFNISENGQTIIQESNIKKKIEFYKREIIFFEKKLKNKNFITKAPPKVVDENRKKLNEAKKNLDFLKKNVQN